MAIGANPYDTGTPWEREEPWRGPVLASAGLHLAFVTTILVVAVVNRRSGAGWGGERSGDSAINATLVSNVAIPLPSTQAPQENVVATESKGLSKPQPVEKVPDQTAIPIPAPQQKDKPE